MDGFPSKLILWHFLLSVFNTISNLGNCVAVFVDVSSWNLDALTDPHMERRELIHSHMKKAVNEKKQYIVV